jgi:hypothetical protein
MSTGAISFTSIKNKAKRDPCPNFLFNLPNYSIPSGHCSDPTVGGVWQPGEAGEGRSLGGEGGDDVGEGEPGCEESGEGHDCITRQASLD